MKNPKPRIERKSDRWQRITFRIPDTREICTNSVRRCKSGRDETFEQSLARPSSPPCCLGESTRVCLIPNLGKPRWSQSESISQGSSTVDPRFFSRGMRRDAHRRTQPSIGCLFIVASASACFSLGRRFRPFRRSPEKGFTTGSVHGRERRSVKGEEGRWKRRGGR